MEIEAVADLDGQLLKCKGTITIHSMKPPAAYVTWKLYNNENNFVAALSRRYFLGKDIPITEDRLIERVINKIENYRVGRKRIFKEVKVVS